MGGRSKADPPTGRPTAGDLQAGWTGRRKRRRSLRPGLKEASTEARPILDDRIRSATGLPSFGESRARTVHNWFTSMTFNACAARRQGWLPSKYALFSAADDRFRFVTKGLQHSDAVVLAVGLFLSSSALGIHCRAGADPSARWSADQALKHRGTLQRAFNGNLGRGGSGPVSYITFGAFALTSPARRGYALTRQRSLAARPATKAGQERRDAFKWIWSFPALRGDSSSRNIAPILLAAIHMVHRCSRCRSTGD